MRKLCCPKFSECRGTKQESSNAVIMVRLTFSMGLAVTLLMVFGHAESAKIVCVFPTASKSHVLGVQALLKELAHRGHEVTMVSAFPLKKPPKNYRDVNVPIEDAFSSIMSDFMQGESRNMLKLFPKILNAAQVSSNVTINTPEFLRLAREEKFDLAIVGFFMNGFTIGVGQLLRCPTVLYFSAAASGFTNVVGNPSEVAAVPHMMLGQRNPMTFLDRVTNTLINGVEKMVLQYIRYTELPYYESNFPTGKGFLSYDEAMRNVSLVLINTHFSQTTPRPYLPNMVEVGGIQINVKPEPLPDDLQQFLDGAGSDGAIYISFGSNLRSSNLRQDKLEAILSMIRGLKQHVIWKWDQDEMPNQPSNVFIGKWLPQDSILGHPNLKLFITHGGLGSTTEAMYHGVPIVGIPMFGDQEGNIKQVVKEGWGLSVSFDELTEENLVSAVKQVLRDPKYRERVAQRAALFKDRPKGALETGVYWVEYVIRHHGAPHLHYQGADLNVFQLALLDVYAFLSAILFVGYKLIVFIGRKLEAYRILCIYPSSGRSHVIVGQALLKGLAERGHDVTMVSPFKLPKPVPNYREIVVQKEDLDHMTRDFLQKNTGNSISGMLNLFQSQFRTAEMTLKDPKFQTLKNEHFDLVIVGLFVADFVLGLGPHFNAPTVVLFSAGMTKMTADFVGNPRSISTVPHMMIGGPGVMNFSTRVKNFLFGCLENVIVAVSVYAQQSYYDRHFPADRYPPYEAVRQNVSLVLLNTHFSQAYTRPYLQNVIEVGGLQIKSKPDPLPEDIREWLDGADEHGVVYFCLGSNLKSADLPQDKLDAILKTFGQLKQRVIWKWESDSIPNIPPNVLTKSWLPQDDVLAHRNVKLFISHGGLGGMAEAKYHGVPVLGIPIFAEQFQNIQTMVEEGMGMRLDYEQLNEQTFTRAVNIMVREHRFAERAKSISNLYRDRPQSAMDLACFWVEYIARHKGAPHLHYSGADLNFLQRESLDVIAFLLVIVYIVAKMLKVIVRFLFRKVFKTSRKTKIQ
uniref:UDP-glycosyltransferases domain-containing protein n=1 Tax=Anopheles farauti TaxID=69004 RepID=A0A182QUR6_9DIPT